MRVPIYFQCGRQYHLYQLLTLLQTVTFALGICFTVPPTEVGSHLPASVIYFNVTAFSSRMLVSTIKERLSGCVYRVELLPLFCIHFSMLRESSGKSFTPNE